MQPNNPWFAPITFTDPDLSLGRAPLGQPRTTDPEVEPDKPVAPNDSDSSPHNSTEAISYDGPRADSLYPHVSNTGQ